MHGNDPFKTVSRRAMGTLMGFAIIISSMIANTPFTEAQPAANPELSQAELKNRRDRIRRFFHDRLQRHDVVATTVTPSGQKIDWIRPESQTADGRLATPPDQPPDTMSPGSVIPPKVTQLRPMIPNQQRAWTEIQKYQSARGPEGTVPVVRFDVDKYLASLKVPPENPRDAFKKMPPPAPESNDRYYVVWQRMGTVYGSSGHVNIWDTTGPVGNETSIGQVAVIRGTPMQAIEAGKIELQSLNGNRRPHFFVYYRTSGSASGDWVGGYKHPCCRMDSAQRFGSPRDVAGTLAEHNRWQPV